MTKKVFTGRVYSSYIPECNAQCKRDLALDKARSTTFTGNNRTIVRQICNVKPEDLPTVRSYKLLAQLEIDYLNVILKENASLVWTH